MNFNLGKYRYNYLKQFIGKRKLNLLIIISCVISLIASIIKAFIDDAEGYNAFNHFIVINFLIITISIWLFLFLSIWLYNKKYKIISMLKTNKLQDKFLTAKDNKIKLSKSLAIGSFFAICIGYSTSELTYRLVQNGKSYIIGVKQHKSLLQDADASKDTWSKKRDFKPTIIIISFVFGTSLSYSLIKKN